MPPDGTDLTAIEPVADVRSVIEAAIDAHEAGDTAPQSGDGASERVRDEAGRFARAEADEGTDAPADVLVPDAPVVTEPVQAAATVEPPINWAEGDKAVFKALPPEGQKFLLDRHSAMEADYTKKTTEIAAFRRDYEPIQQMFAPFEQQLRQAGMTKAQVVEGWHKAELQLMNGQGVNLIRDIVTNYRIDKGALSRALGFSSAAPGVDPPPAAEGAAPIQLPPELAQTLQTFEQKQAQMENFLRQQEQSRLAQETDRVMGTITMFMEAKDGAGNLHHPHFAEVEGAMERFAAAARARGETVPSLDELYEQAVWATPSTRAKEMDAINVRREAERTAANADAAKEARAKAERARRAGSSVTGSPGLGQSAPTSTQTGSKSVRQALEAALDEHEAA